MTKRNANDFISEPALFRLLLVIFTALSIWPIWACRFLPMQDYPQHLFLSHLISTFDNTTYNWKEFYRVDLGLRPYMLWYLAMRLLTSVGAGVETAGKILFSLYLVLIAVLALDTRRLAPKDSQPWGALLLFPFAFSQIFFLGFANYLISLPLLFLAFLDFDRFGEPLKAGRMARHALYLLLLMLNHPYTILVYIALALISALLSSNRRERVRLFAMGGVVSLIFAAWLITQHEASSAPTSFPWAIWWLKFAVASQFYLSIFTGMKWYGGPNWISVVLWGMIAAVFLVAAKRELRHDPFALRLARLYVVCLIGYLFIPYYFGYYSYFNLRLAPVSYFMLSLLLCRVRLPLRGAALVGACTLGIILISIQTQRALAREMETILPVISAIPKNALILPLIYDSRPEAIDQRLFNEMHLHDADYYHVVTGGGANPTLFPNAMMPVQYRPGLQLPYTYVEQFNWRKHGAFYDYLLTRGAPANMCRTLSLTCSLVAESGPWKAFRNKMPRKPL